MRGDQKAIDIIDASIEAHGGDHYNEMDVSFDYRKFRMRLMQDDGAFSYERTFTDSLGQTVHDILDNDGFSRETNGKLLDLSEKDSLKYKDGLNAIAYFALLPYKLRDPAVRLKYLGESSIDNKKYDKIAVTFVKLKGGKDHLDEFCFWINQRSHSMDYFSYSNGGARFRKAVAQKNIDGVIFQDYENYVILDSTLSSNDYDKAFNAGKDSLLSRIEQTNYTLN